MPQTKKISFVLRLIQISIEKKRCWRMSARCCKLLSVCVCVCESERYGEKECGRMSVSCLRLLNRACGECVVVCER